MAHSDVIALSGLVLPAQSLLRRDFPRPADRRDARYEALFDAHTLAYDHWIGGGRLHLLCPRLLNLWPEMRAALHPRRSRHLRWELLTCPMPSEGQLAVGGIEFPLAPGAELHDLFAGLRVLMAVSKDNPLDWIADWARFHVQAQGSEAVLLFDNGSTAYAPEEIAERLAGVPRLRRALVVRAPYPYGPAHGRTAKLEVPARFYQTAMFNLARLRMLARARSVLSIDIDEMVAPGPGPGLHAETEARLFGLTRIPGTWVYCATKGAMRPQRDHDHVPMTPAPCTPKWCVAPGKLAGRKGWTVHRIFGDLDALFAARGHRFLHCQQSSTSWKIPRQGAEDLRPDPALRALWDHFLAPEARNPINISMY